MLLPSAFENYISPRLGVVRLFGLVVANRAKKLTFGQTFTLRL